MAHSDNVAMDLSTGIYFNTTAVDLSTTGYSSTTAMDLSSRHTSTADINLYVEPAEAETWGPTKRGRSMLMGAMGAALNVLTLVAVVRHNDLTRYLRCVLVSLVTTDLGMLTTVFTGSLIYRPPDTVTKTLTYITWVCFDCTALTLLVIAADRAIAVYFPACYKTTERRRQGLKILLSVLCPWLLALGFAVASCKTDIRGLSRDPLSSLTDTGWLMQAPLLLVCGFGVLLAYLAVGVRLRLRKRRFVVNPAFLSCAALPQNITPAEGQRCRRLTVHIAFLAVWFCLVYIPFSCYLFFLYTNKVDISTEANSPRYIAMTSIVIFNSIVNPFLIFWRLVSFSSVKSVLRGVLPRRNPVGSPVQSNPDCVEMAVVAEASMRVVVEPSRPACFTRGHCQSGPRSSGSRSSDGNKNKSNCDEGGTTMISTIVTSFVTNPPSC